MSASTHTASLWAEIRKEFDKSWSELDLKVLANGQFIIPEDISHIQDLHDKVVQDLESLKKNLEAHISIIEKTELIMNILNYKLYEDQFEFRTQLDKLQMKKGELTRRSSVGGMSRSSVELQLVELADEVAKLEETHQKDLESIKEQKIDAQKAYERAIQQMDQNFEKMSHGYNKLLLLIEAQKSKLGDSQAQILEAGFADELERFKKDIETFTELQTTGWKVLYPDEKISELLQERGLKVMQSGLLVNKEGDTVRLKKASKLLGEQGADVLDRLKGLVSDVDSVTSTSSSSSESGSKMSSEDVNYLKVFLGKPLTLALAEITSLQPKDPIHYLAHWLFKYRYNQQVEDINEMEFEILNEKRTKIAKERWHKFIEEEARAAVIDMIVRAENIAAMHELTRIQMEEEAMEEMEEARDTLGPYNGPSTGQIPL